MMDRGVPERVEGADEAAEPRTDASDGASAGFERRDLMEDEPREVHGELSSFEYAALAPVPEPSAEPFRYLTQEPPVIRHPNFADAMLFLLMMLVGALLTTAGLGVALYFHWFGLRDLESATKSTPVALGTQFLIYVLGLSVAIPFFRMVWHKRYFAGLNWHAERAFRLRYWLVAVAFLLNVLALVVGQVVKFPEHAPIDKMFATSSDAWLLACFGVLVAPFFEEMIFRGFLLPAMATAWDWAAEKMHGERPRALDGEGNPVWSAGAMVFAALVVSAPFAWMHSAQVAQAWGPLLLLYCVSLALCAVRLAARSLAASTLVHSAYNCMLFALMFAQTDGFRHLDKM
jgi:membrane protease YdiL (CAAX protease family)